ncbi:MAG: hypothetical protein AABZ26_00410, partial [Chloroflexota bacterium]
AWAFGALPVGGLLPFVAAPLAIRLGDTVSHCGGNDLDGALREALLLVLAFGALLGAGLALPDPLGRPQP